MIHPIDGPHFGDLTICTQYVERLPAPQWIVLLVKDHSRRVNYGTWYRMQVEALTAIQASYIVCRRDYISAYLGEYPELYMYRALPY